jgi:chromosome segregation ATPase
MPQANTSQNRGGSYGYTRSDDEIIRALESEVDHLQRRLRALATNAANANAQTQRLRARHQVLQQHVKALESKLDEEERHLATLESKASMQNHLAWEAEKEKQVEALIKSLDDWLDAEVAEKLRNRWRHAGGVLNEQLVWGSMWKVWKEQVLDSIPDNVCCNYENI